MRTYRRTFRTARRQGAGRSSFWNLEHPEPKMIFLLAVTRWAFWRFYYFMFYVIERYVDPTYRFNPLFDPQNLTR